MSEKLLEVKDLHVSYGGIRALRGVNLEVPDGRIVTLIGANGAGKSTLLRTISGLVKAESGSITYDGKELLGMPINKILELGLAQVPEGRRVCTNLSVLENVAFPALMYRPQANVEKEALALLERFDIARLRDASPSELSGGELRRVAIARALINRPAVLLADEPTGDLDDENTALVLETLRGVARDGAAVLMVTHEADAVNYADRVLRMNAGVLSEVSQAQ